MEALLTGINMCSHFLNKKSLAIGKMFYYNTKCSLLQNRGKSYDE